MGGGGFSELSEYFVTMPKCFIFTKPLHGQRGGMSDPEV